MANGENFFGLKSGSTKSLTFAVSGGKQIIKDRVYKVKNPRSDAQMRQRVFMATIGAAYKAMKDIVNHSFEGVTYGAASMQKFNSENLALIKADALANAGRFGYCIYNDARLLNGSYKISEGSLPQAANPIVDSIDAGNSQTIFKIAATDMASFCEANGLRIGGYHTMCVLFPEQRFGGYAFGFVRLAVLAEDSAALTADNINSKFSVAFGGQITGASISYANGNIVITAKTPAIPSGAAANVATCAINSLKANDEWKRSTAVFSVAGASPSFAVAFATWPVGQAMVLNGGVPTVTGGSSTPDQGGGGGDTPAPTTYQLSSSRSGQYGSAVVTMKVDGATVASGSYVEAGKTVNVEVSNAADMTALNINGSAISVTTDGTTKTGSFTMPSRSTSVVAVFPTGGGGDDEPGGDDH